MSSDSILKSSTNQHLCLHKLLRILLALGLLLLIFLYTIIGKSTNKSEQIEIFTQDEITRARNDLPKACGSTLNFVLYNQRQAKIARRSLSPSSQTIVFACHRKWCDSYGFCQPCSGIGDRTRHLLGSITEALSRKLSVELDYPQVSNGIDLRFRKAFEYKDRWGFVSEWFHFRSYDVSRKELHLERWGGGDDDEKGLAGGMLEDQFVHFIPLYGSKTNVEYDPCLYHVLFRPTPQLQTQIMYYSNIFHLDTENVLGIHFRTGDSTAFSVPNKDIRAAGSSLEQGYDRMLECAEKLATRLNIHPMVDTNNGGGNGDGEVEKLHFYLATDNQHVKDLAKKEKNYVIHLTDDRPSAYLRAEGDRSAFLELYLLSKTRGLVINQLPKNYHGGGNMESTFAGLAKNIGFMTKEQIMPCSLE